jgi:hypothetical protein
MRPSNDPLAVDETSGAMFAIVTSSAWRRQALKNDAVNNASAIVYCEAISFFSRALISRMTSGSA